MEDLVSEGKAPSREFWRGRRVLLTGHTGFKGAWMTLLLHRLGADVHGISLPEPVSQPNLFEAAAISELCTDRRGDIRDAATLSAVVADVGPSVVIHMAAQAIVRLSFRAPAETFAVNVMGVVNILEACRAVSELEAVAIVTSDKCYENREQPWPYRESDAMGGHDPYSASKGAAELVAASYARTFFASPTGPRVASVRAGNVIGGGDWASDRLLPDLVRAALDGSIAAIRNPVSIRPWQHVLDPLAGYLLAIEHIVQSERRQVSDSWNFGPNPGEELPVQDVVEFFQQAWDGRPEVTFGQPQAHEHEASILRVDPTKAKVELGWRPCTSTAGAIDAVVKWSRAYAADGGARGLALSDIERLLNL